ncbi:hypothetical protein QYF36_000002 [Acer negundo]|nr:hypothetical protein QYF36_000002 [Acer negundo]
MFFKSLLVLSVLFLGCFETQFFVAAKLPQSEVDALNHIAKTMGATDWNFDANACGVMKIPVIETDPTTNLTCNTVNNKSHIIAIKFKRWSLSGVLPPELVQLPYIEEIDFAYNYLNGSIPVEWDSIQLKLISLFGNRLSGNIPSHLGNITSLIYLDLEANQFSGTVPAQLGKLVNLEILRLSSNRLSGNLPMELAELKNLRDFRINDNYFNGSIPDFIQSWMELKRLEIEGSGLEGPIPSSISVLKNLAQLRISDINGKNQAFPELANMTALRRMILRSCSISGEIPQYIWGLNNLRLLDLSFNNLTGELPNVPLPGSLRFIFLNGNSLGGKIPQAILKKGTNVDLSYNNFTQTSSEQPACQETQNLNLNLFRSSSAERNLSGVLPCQNNFKCHRYWHSFYINCGGQNVKVNGSTFEGDAGISGGTATYHLYNGATWGLSSTGDFMDDDDEQNTHYIAVSNSSLMPELYTNARVAPVSLAYFGYCLENGNYLVTLHFAEILFKDDNTYRSLGRRIFDIYVQDKLVEKDFNIEAEAYGVLKPVSKLYNVTVTNNVLEIRFHWAGKGTTTIPIKGAYGPLVSAISVVNPNFKPRKKNIAPIVGGAFAGFCIIVLVLGILYWRYYCRTKSRKQTDLKGLDLQTSVFTLMQIKAATNDFDSLNKIGEGGFGPVYKGLLSDEDQLLLVYEYMENNSLARALFGHEQFQLKLDWPTRHRICLGIAKGLAFLHEESRFKIVHRDIKPTNVLLDRDLNPKISDFGLAKLDEEEKTHISTRIAGTIGYMAPEYAQWGHLTHKADVYSFGVVAFEIAIGKNNTSYVPNDDYSCFLEWACHLQQNGKLMEMVDVKLGSEFDAEEAERMLKVSLLCTNSSPSLRPTMSKVVGMLEGTTKIPDIIPQPANYSQDIRFKTIRDQRQSMHSQSSVGSQACYPTSVGTSHSFSTTSGQELNKVNE